MEPTPPASRRAVVLALLLILAVNLAIVWKLFGVAFSAYTSSIEGTFIAIPRVMARYPGQWAWWPFWGCGMPFETAYLPFSHWICASFILLTHIDAPHAFHIVSAAIYAGSALAVFWMAHAFSRRFLASLAATLLYSCFSFSNLFFHEVRADSGSLFFLRRLQILVFYGESPHTAALAFLPLAIVCFAYALSTSAVRWKLLAAVATAAVVLSNAFGITALGIAVACWLLAFPQKPWWKAPLVAAAISLVTYAWISPWLSPTLLHAIRARAPIVAGGFHYRSASWMALIAVAVAFALACFAMRVAKAPAHVRFFVLFAIPFTAIPSLWYWWRIAIIPQPGRYQLEMDLALPLAVVFVVDWLAAIIPLRERRAALAVVAAALTAQTATAIVYAHDLIREGDPAHMPEVRIARWLDRNRPTERTYASGSAGFLLNAISDNPLVRGGHEQQAISPFLDIVEFTLFSDMNAGNRGAEYSIFWLKAFGAHTVTVPGPNTAEAYKPYVHPRKFEGVLRPLWHEGDDTIYEVSPPSASLAHVIPASAVVAHTPIHGLDLAPAEAYVAALEDPHLPRARFRWTSLSEAEIHAPIDRGEVIHLQITYTPGWEAWSRGRRLAVRPDALGLMAIEPAAPGDAEISLRYTGGAEHRLTRALSILAMVLAAIYALLARRRAIMNTRWML